MLRNYFLVNTILLLLLMFGVYQLYSILANDIEISLDVPDIQDKNKAASAAEKSEALQYTLFDAIAQKDLFRPDRKPPAVIVEEKKAETPPPKNQPKLFGTIILNDKKTAILEDPGTKTTKIYGINDTVGGYTITDITENMVVLVWNSERVEVRLRDDKGISPSRPSVINQPVNRIQPSQIPRRPRQRPSRRRPVQRNQQQMQNGDINPGGQAEAPIMDEEKLREIDEQVRQLQQ
ncbi:MAG: hypothetical protein ISR96_09720 [Nitrospira sp.]|nr:hypothetical protein [bacterium]MBL7049778.1 hypothetical protein [Nitrospira sp.]